MDKNRQLRIEDVLQEIISDDQTHVRWLDTLSYLENVGAHKIMAFQKPSEASLNVLQHAHEETRHAWFFKKLTTYFKLEPRQAKKLLGLPLSKHYLNLLDLKVMRELRAHFDESHSWCREASYFLTTYVIEVRAAKIYHVYERLLREYNFPFSLKLVLKEEASHLREMESALQKRVELLKITKDLLLWEEDLFSKLLISLKDSR